MKKILFFLLMPVLAFAQPTQGYVITGTINGLADNSEVSLINGADGSVVAKSTVKNGSFTIKGQQAPVSVYQLGFTGRKDVLDFFMGNDAVSVKGNLNDL